LLVDSIRLRLRSDVPVGTSLSGGVDSSVLVALSAELGRDHRRHAFTATFPGYEHDEWPYAEQVAHAAEVVEHHAVWPDADALATDLPTLVADQEEPFGSTSIYAQWRVMRAAREAGVVVLLDGQGADELFGGYPWTPGFAIASQGAAAVARALVGRTESFATLKALVWGRLPAGVARRHWRRLANPYVTSEVVDAALDFEPTTPPFASGSAIRQELIRETFVTSLPALLRYADRSSMASAREVRLPFLDRRVAEFALSLPAEFIYRNGTRKRIIRDVGRGRVPDQVLGRRDKIAFEPPQERWISTSSWRDRIAEVLLDPITRARGIYYSETIEEDARAGVWRDHAAIWRAYCAELWRVSCAAPRALHLGS
jgi:asparagine synthase (glutamine-hydrolysing)